MFEFAPPSWEFLENKEVESVEDYPSLTVYPSPIESKENDVMMTMIMMMTVMMVVMVVMMMNVMVVMMIVMVVMMLTSSIKTKTRT